MGLNNPSNATSLTGQRGAAAGTDMISVGVAADTFDRWVLNADGSWELGPGNAATDLTVSRAATKDLRIAASDGRIDFISNVFGAGAGMKLASDGPFYLNPGSSGIGKAIVIGDGASFSMRDASTSTVYSIDVNGRPRAQQSAPTPSTLAASTAVSVDANAHDEAGVVNFTPANAVAVDTAVVRVTFANAHTNAPAVVITPMNGESAKVQGLITNVGTGAFDIAIHVPSAVAAACKFAFRVVGV